MAASCAPRGTQNRLRNAEGNPPALSQSPVPVATLGSIRQGPRPAGSGRTGNRSGRNLMARMTDRRQRSPRALAKEAGGKRACESGGIRAVTARVRTRCLSGPRASRSDEGPLSGRWRGKPPVLPFSVPGGIPSAQYGQRGRCLLVAGGSRASPDPVRPQPCTPAGAPVWFRHG